MTVRSGLLLALPLSLLVAAGCAGDKFGTRTETWGQVGGSDYQDTRTTPKPAEPQKLTAREYAARFANGVECEREARATLPNDERGGVALLRACLERDDFDMLEPFYAPPWRQHLDDEQSRVPLAQVIARRGGWVSEDLALLQRADDDVYTLGQAVEQPEEARGKTLITRLRYLEPHEGVPGQLVFEEATLSPDDVELEEEISQTARFPTALAGQRVLLELPEAKRPPRAGDELIVVGELLGLEPVLNRESMEEEDWAVLRVRARFVPEVRARE